MPIDQLLNAFYDGKYKNHENIHCCLHKNMKFYMAFYRINKTHIMQGQVNYLV